MVTYVCNKCGQDFARTELDKPVCFYCEAEGDCEIVNKQEITPEIIAERLKLVNERMMENLKKAYMNKPDGVDEDELLEVMSKAKELCQETDKVWEKKLKEDEKDKAE